jgi:hypothetical protein
MSDRTVKILRAVEVVALSLSAITSIGMFFVATGFDTEVDFVGGLFYLWMIVPVAVFFAVSRALHRRRPTRALPMITCVTSVLMLGVAGFAYADAILIDPSSDALNVFIFVPLSLLLGGPLVMAVSWFIGTRDSSAQQISVGERE